jgi:hypothetical protein
LSPVSGVRYAAFALVFVVLATLNAAGYRYGASDQALYIPAIVRHLEPAAFPRDAPLIDAQARLMLNDDLAAGLVRTTRLSLPQLFAALYIFTLVLLLAAGVRIASRLYRTRWAVAALAAALTLRHAVAKTGANTLEGYFHPRQLAFALGLLALGSFLDRRERSALVLVGCAAVLHPTTAAWFGVWLGVALWVARPEWRRGVLVAAAAGAAAGLVALGRGSLAGHLVRMDPDWLAVIADRDYLFPLGWPVNVWLTNLVTIPVIAVCWRIRRRAGLTTPGEDALVIGALALAVVFFCWLPFNAAHVAIAVQLQATRVFWMLDVFATFYLVWALAEGTAARPQTAGAGPLTVNLQPPTANRTLPTANSRRAAIVTALILAASLARGLYICFVDFPDRPIFAVDLHHDDWRSAMAWARTTDPRSGWLADPWHAAKYGSSLRAAGWRDVLIEALKDPAIAMYDRETAMHVAERQRALSAFRWDTAEGAAALAQRFGLDYLVIDREMNLPLAHQSGSLYIYRLR